MKEYNQKIAPKANAELIWFNMDKNEATSLAWAVKEKFPWPMVKPKYHKRSGLLKFRGEKGIPYYILIDKRGEKISDGHSFQNIVSQIKEL